MEIHNDVALMTEEQVLAKYADDLRSIARTMYAEADELEAYANRRAVAKRARAAEIIAHAEKLEGE